MRQRFTMWDMQFVIGDCARLVWVQDFYPSGKVRIATFGRLNMTSNAHAARRVA